MGGVKQGSLLVQGPSLNPAERQRIKPACKGNIILLNLAKNRWIAALGYVNKSRNNNFLD